MAKQGTEAAAGEDRRREAQDLAREAVEESKAGRKDEARFVLDEAKRLDPGAVEKTLHEEQPQAGRKSGKR